MIIKRYIDIYRKKQFWLKNNKNNQTWLIEGNPDLIFVGDFTYGGIYAHMSRKDVKLIIGRYCSISQNVKFILSSDHPTSFISTFPFKTLLFENENLDALAKGDTIVGDDVWIGESAIILSGVHIGQGAVVAAGSIVTNDVPPYAIVGGSPAKIIKYRFDGELIDELLKVDYSKLTKEIVQQHIDELYVELIDKSQLEWMPKR